MFSFVGVCCLFPCLKKCSVRIILFILAWLSALNGHAIASALCRQSAFLSLKIILFSLFECDFRLKLGRDLNFCKDRKRIKISEEWKNFVELVNSHYITVFRCKNCTQLDFSIKFFVGVETPTYKLIIYTLLCKICFWVPTNRT